MSDRDQSMERPALKDRSTGLAVFGFLQILMGGFCVLLIPLMLMSLWVTPPGGASANAQALIPTAVFYAGIAVLLFALGIGSIRSRRWARALTLTLSWMWLAMGVVSSIVMVFVIPKMSDAIAQQGQLPPQAMTVMYVTMIGTIGCMYLLLPGIFIAFYQRADVKATCELRDPKVCWTDRCPLPVLSLSLLLGLGASSVVWSAGYGFVAPVFGFVLKGVPGALFFIGVSLLFVYLAWAIYRLKMSAWWATLGLVVFFGLSAIVTFSRISLLDFYREMNFPEDQLKMMKDVGVFDMNFPLIMGVNLVVILGYLLWVRSYLVAASATQLDP